MEKKYKLTKTTKNYLGKTLYQIEALKDFGGVKKGDRGGWIEKEDNLSQEGNAWVYGNARVSDNALVYGNAQVYGDAWVFDNAQVYGDAWVFDNALVSGDARVFDDARVSDNAWIYGDARVSGDVQVFGDARVSGNAWVYGNAVVCGRVKVCGNARLSSKSKFIRGFFVGGSDENNITEITNKTGSTYWNHQYVLGEYKIEPIDEAKKEDTEEKMIEIGGKKISESTILEALKHYLN